MTPARKPRMSAPIMLRRYPSVARRDARASRSRSWAERRSPSREAASALSTSPEPPQQLGTRGVQRLVALQPGHALSSSRNPASGPNANPTATAAVDRHHRLSRPRAPAPRTGRRSAPSPCPRTAPPGRAARRSRPGSCTPPDSEAGRRSRTATPSATCEASHSARSCSPSAIWLAVAQPCRRPRVGQQEQRQQPVRLGGVRHQPREQARHAHGLAAQLRNGPRRAPR